MIERRQLNQRRIHRPAPYARLLFTILAPLALIIGATVACGYVVNNAELDVSGKVVSANDGLPVPGALVAIESVSPGPTDDPGLGQYVKTDSNGRFSARVRGIASLRAWKPGYRMKDLQLGSASNLLSQEINVELREVLRCNLVNERVNRQGYFVGDGFSLESGKIGAADDPVADIRLVYNLEGKETVVEALGEGGVIFQAFGENVDYYNSPEAPESGYRKSAAVPNVMGIFFVRTKDWRHYGKIRFTPGAVRDARSRQAGEGYWIQWSYQPGGTRCLEVAPSKHMPFPFFKFGADAEPL